MTEPNPDARARKLERQRQYREANREQLREKKRQYYAANGDKIRERERENYRPEKKRQYYAANRARISERQRAYYQANRQERLEAVKAYAEANPDKIRDGRRRYYALRGGKVRLDALRQAHGSDFDATWAAMWDAQQGRCYLCERAMDPAEAFMEHWHGCPGHGSKKSCRYCQRGLAHHNCNIVVGHAGDDPAILRIIADNLERANADIAARQAVMPQHITLF